MNWTELRELKGWEFGEVKGDVTSLQEHFNEWSDRRARRAGTPQWLEKIRMAKPEKRLRDRWGFGYEPDLVGTDNINNYVIELKYAAKYEPLAIGEVLHHADALGSAGNAKSVAVDASYWTAGLPVVPVVVGQWNTWTRGAVDYLRRMKISYEALRYVEVVALCNPRVTEELLWLEEYGAPWDAVDDGPPTARSGVTGEASWYKARDADAWRARPKGVVDEVPAPGEEYASFAQVGDADLPLAMWFGRNERACESHYFMKDRFGSVEGKHPPFAPRRGAG